MERLWDRFREKTSLAGVADIIEIYPQAARDSYETLPFAMTRFFVLLLFITLPLNTGRVAAQDASAPSSAQSEQTVKEEENKKQERDDDEEQTSFEDEVTVIATTRTGRRVEDEPIRVEVVPQEEIDEKVFMTPGDVSMMLTETNGLRVQVTSPSLGAASVRVQGLRGRYTQVLADGLPLYGPPGTIGILHIPPMDLAQVEVIKGVASALYGGSALGGVINLISRQPRRDRPERELLLNQNSRGGTDGVLWLSKRGEGNWGYTFLGGAHFQNRNDIDDDGWTDLPTYRRVTARPRVMWEDGSGRSVFVTGGVMAENRRGGSMPDASAPDGLPFPENLTTRRFDGGIVARVPFGSTRLLTLRSSGLGQWHGHTFGPDTEHDFHHTWFGEAAITGQSGRHTWVAGAAVQRDKYSAQELPAFDYNHVVPGVFAQDDLPVTDWLALSGSVRADFHNVYGSFVSPRISALLHSTTGWTARLSTGTGFVAPTPFIEETEAAGLSQLQPLGSLEPERGRSVSFDVGWKRGALELNATLFASHINDALFLEDDNIVNARGPVRTRGSELIARYHVEGMDLIATHMFVWSTEPNPDAAGRREVPLNPRHTAGIDWLWEIEERVRLGVEFFYTGRQQLEHSPYRLESEPYLLWGAVAEWRVGRARLFINVENLSDIRQTSYDPLVRPSPGPLGVWTVDAWGPLEGRILNGGIRVGF
jgi:iron complex outermembrane receptor protein